MKSRVILPLGPIVAVLSSALTIASIMPVSAAPGKAPAPAPAAAVEIPQAQFTMPTNYREGRDPFFPDSIRPYSTGIARVKSTVDPVQLAVNGLSGTTEHPLAIINNRTFAEGEEGEVTGTGGRVRIRCTKITRTAVTIEIGGGTRELRVPE